MRYVIADPSKPIEIGYERDAKTMNVHFDVSDFIKDYPGCTCHLSYIRPTVKQPYEPENTRIIGNELVWNVSAADAEFSGYGSVQIVMLRNDDQVAHGPEMTVHVNESHNSTAEPPEEPIQAWFVRVMAAQDEAKDLAEKVLSMTVDVETLPAGSEATAEYDAETGVMRFGIPAGEDGVDGVSPAVEIEDIMGGHSITITDKDHPSGQTFEVMDGEDGEVPIDDTEPAADKVYSSQKVSSEISQLNQAKVDIDQGVQHAGKVLGIGADGMVTPVTGGSGGGAVEDVKIDGTSVVDSDGVANIPICSSDEYGLVKGSTSTASQIHIKDDGTLKLNTSTNQQINARNSNAYPICTNKIDYTVKAAMCDGVGAAWTSSEKAAAQTRIGIVTLTQEEYDLIDTPDPNTIYIIAEGSAST